MHWLFGKRFIPYAELERAERVPSEGLVLSLSGGERLRLGARNAGGEYIDALCARIQAARAAAMGASVATTALPLERDGRTLARWREALRAVVAGDGYRTRHVDRSDLLVVLEDAAAPAERRIGAALALRELDGQEARVRIGAVAAAVANDRLRVALDGIGQDSVDEAAIEEALAAESDRAHASRD